MRNFPAAGVVLLGIACLHADPASTGTRNPTFNRDIAPIIFENCSNCHRTGEVAPFALLNYQDVAKRAKQIVAITQARVMPPWKATPGYGQFTNERRLTDQQLAAIRDWAMNGAPEGDPADKPAPPKFTDGWQAGAPDQVAAMQQPFTVPADGPDQFRCFVIPLNAQEDEYVKTVEFRPGNRKVVHHAILYLDNSGEARKREEAPGHGYDCVGGPGLEISAGLGGWAPGATPTVLPSGVAQTVKKGADLIIQLHYHPDGKSEIDKSMAGITFTKEQPTKGLAMLLVGNLNIDIPAGQDQYVVKATGTLPMDGEALGIFPHAHYLCKDMKVDAHLPDGTVQPMIWIKDWDFNWQGAYRYATPMKLPKGTRIEMQYTYDNSAANPHNPSTPPREVKYGEQTTNEMGFAFVSVTLENPGDVSQFQRSAQTEMVVSMLESGMDLSALGPRRAAGLKMLLNAFDKNHNGKIDPEERPALVAFMNNRSARR